MVARFRRAATALAPWLGWTAWILVRLTSLSSRVLEARRPARSGVLLPAALTVLTVLAAGCGHSPRKTAAEVLGSTMLAELPPVVRVHVVGRQQPTRAHPSRSYPRAVIFHDRRSQCPKDDPRSVRCGAKLEFHKNRARARRRMARLRVRNLDHRREFDFRRDTMILRVSAGLGESGAAAYRQAFRDATATSGHLLPDQA